MTGEEKTSYLRIGLGLSGVVVNDFTAEIIWRTLEGLQKKGGKFSVSDSVEIELLVKGKMEQKKISLEDNSKNSRRKVEREKHQSKKFGHKEHKVSKSLVVKSYEVNKGVYQYCFSKIVPSIHFKNKVGKKCILTRKMENDGKSVVLDVGGKFIKIYQSQMLKFAKLIEKKGFNSDEVYELAYDISNNFSRYHDATGKLVSVFKEIINKK